MSAPADPGLLDFARKAQAIAQNGLAFSRDPFDRERYTQLMELVAGLLSTQLQIPLAVARAFWRDCFRHSPANHKIRSRGRSIGFHLPRAAHGK